MSSERESIARAQDGDRAAQEELVRRHAPLVFRVVSRFFRQREDVEDLAQDVFLKVFRELGQVRPDENFPGWLRTVAVHTCYDALRRIRRRQTAMETYGPPSMGEPVTMPAEPEGLGRARIAVDALDPKFRTPFLLKEVEGMSVAEIAASMGITETNVKVRLFRARKRLEAALGGRRGDDERLILGRRQA
jgi:RNA polymerase sigma-70 factor (ECF subfamily)